MYYEIVSERKAPSYHIIGPEDAYKALVRYAKRKAEHFLVITLNGANDVIAVRIVSIGTVNRTLVHPREVFLPAIKDNSVSIIICHNHPSGRLDPSDDDLEVTRRLQAAGEILGISVMDHIIIGPTGYRSMMH